MNGVKGVGPAREQPVAEEKLLEKRERKRWQMEWKHYILFSAQKHTATQ